MSNHPVPNPVSQDSAPSGEESSFGDILSQFEQDQTKTDLKGFVISVSDDGILMNIGRKIEGVLAPDQVRDSSGKVKLKAGDSIPVTITGRDENGYYMLSAIKTVTPRDWSGLEKAYAGKAVVTGIVEEVIKGGLRVDLGVRAFLPASRSGARDAEEMEKLVGQQIECRITKLDTAKEDVVVDRRVILEERAAKNKEEAFSKLEEGAVVTGTVRSLTEFGAFVDLGGVDGLLHVAEMSWVRGAKAEDFVKAGDRIEVKILKIQPETRKISLSTKQLQADPWTAAAGSYRVGDRINGTVTRLADFGAFVQIQPGVEGLIHVSEMSWSRKQRRPSEIVSQGESVEVVILGINLEEKRIALGLKQVLGDPWEEAQRKFPAGTVVEAQVTSLQNFGAFVELGEGLEGLIHIGDITNEKRLDHPREALTVGKSVRAVVLEVDQQRKRVRLGMRQLEPTSADEYIQEHKVGDEVSGRIVELGKEKAKIELGEGITASCRLETKPAEPAPSAEPPKTDLNSMTAMLEAKWKKGQQMGPGKTQAAEPARAGQVRRFRIVGMDPSQKRIDLELAG